MDRAGLKGKRVLVAGLGGKTGVSAARLLSRLGCSLVLADNKSAEALAPTLRELEGIDFTLQAGGMPPELAAAADLILLSPGVPRSIPLVQAALALGREVIGDVELAWRLMPNPFAGITGTDGKSTTTSMVGSILEAGGRGTVAGNIGIPVLDLAGTVPDEKILCLELSSFQLESCPTFCPRAAMLLNIRPDHLDRYADMDEYLDAKLNIFRNLDPACRAVLPADDPEYPRMRAAVPQDVPLVRFGERGEGLDASLQEGRILLDGRELLRTEELRVKGFHNARNALAAAAFSLALGIPAAEIRAGLLAYGGLAHRYEDAGSAGGVSFINDSKATTISAVAAAAGSARPGAALLLGGKNKGLDFSGLRPLLEEKGLALYYFGAAGPEVRDMVGLPGDLYPGVGEALTAAFRDQRGTAAAQVILAPGGTSYDQFKDFEERGRFVKDFVVRLRGEYGP